MRESAAGLRSFLRIAASALSSLALLAPLAGCGERHDDGPPIAEPFSLGAARVTSEAVFTPIPAHRDGDEKKIALGRRLFAEPRISGNGRISCLTCHHPDKALTDGLALPRLPGQPEAAFNISTVYNVTFNFRFNWNGKYDSLEAQLDTPILGEAAMASSWKRVVEVLDGDPTYRRGFRDAYDAPIDEGNVRDALASFERTLVTPGAPFDQYLRGNEEALEELEREGLELFKSLGCVSCHQGQNIGGNLFQKFGVFGDYFVDRGRMREADLGRYLATGREEDRYVFRVPSLRNVALTPPYFHDGSAPSLETAVEVMGRYQLGRELEPSQIERIVAFLHTLTGEMPALP